MIEFIEKKINIPVGKGTRVIPASVNFSRDVISANVVMNGFRFDYKSDDHHINVIQADTRFVSRSGKKVNFEIQCQYADKNFDDEYFGDVQVLVIAEVDKFTEDMRQALTLYPTANCDTQIINFSYPGSVLNAGEIFQFQIKVVNQSHLDMQNVRVRAIGSSFADVATSTGSFGGSVISNSFNLEAHSTHISEVFRGKAKQVTSSAQRIVTAQIYSWDANLDHILRDHSGAGAPEGELVTAIGAS